jgi:hypothetical protein
MKPWPLIFSLFPLLFLTISGCAPTNLRDTHAPGAATTPLNLSANTGIAVDRLLGSMSPPLSVQTTVLVASFVDLNALSASNRLGRLLAEQTAAHLIQRGYQVPEARLTDDKLYIRSGAELMLSSDTTELRPETHAGVVVTGTYTSVAGITYVNLRAVDINSHLALGAAELELPDQFSH